jgi:hAT family C-terminal dimerisation region
VNLAWAKLEEYDKLMDNTPVYAAALFLYLKFRFEYFKNKWVTKALRPYQKTTLQAIRSLYEEQYRRHGLTELALHKLDSEQEEEDIFNQFVNSNSTPKDELDVHLNAPTTTSLGDENLFRWWANSGSPQLMSMAFDILPTPAMCAETERIFSGTKLTISPQRKRLEDDIIEATECLNRWYKEGI